MARSILDGSIRKYSPFTVCFICLEALRYRQFILIFLRVLTILIRLALSPRSIRIVRYLPGGHSRPRYEASGRPWGPSNSCFEASCSFSNVDCSPDSCWVTRFEFWGARPAAGMRHYLIQPSHPCITFSDPFRASPRLSSFPRNVETFSHLRNLPT